MLNLCDHSIVNRLCNPGLRLEKWANWVICRYVVQQSAIGRHQV
jgi:hypothetical protein